jgi:O-methyltransferase involved in polyketide biosynthesis
MIAQIRVCVTNIPDTFEEFIMRFLRSIFKRCQRFDIVADTYIDNSIKGEERARRRTSSKIFIGSINSKMPTDMIKFMMINDNKDMLINLVFQIIVNNKSDVLEMLLTE